MAKITDYFDEEEIHEEAVYSYEYTNYPKPIKHWKAMLERFDQSIEESYFWILRYLRTGPPGAYNEVIKIIDLFSASEQSSFFAASQTRLGLQQDKVSQFLATIGKMVKELFQLVRELRVIDERLDLYNGSYQSDQAAEIALKGYWIDLVEGGAKNPASVYGMARELQFGTLPDLFFGSKAMMKASEVESYVKSLTDFNSKVREVLMRKLKTYLTWKEHTYKELKTRRIFTIKFLRQHWDVIHMYMNWAKPYLLNIRRMHLNQKEIDRDPNILSAFEGSIVELEFLATNKQLRRVKDGEYLPCALVHFNFRTVPKMDYHQQEYHHKGPIHVGRATIDFRAYAWTKQDIDNYIHIRESENMELLSTIDESVKAAMEALGDELVNYLREAGETKLLPLGVKKDNDSKPYKQPGIIKSIFGGFGELFGSFGNVHKNVKNGQVVKKKIPNRIIRGKKMAEAASSAKQTTWYVYKNYKKSHKMLAW